MRLIITFLLLMTLTSLNAQTDTLRQGREIYRDTFFSSQLNVIKERNEDDYEILNAEFDMDSISYADEIYIAPYKNPKIKQITPKSRPQYNKAKTYGVKKVGKIYKHNKRKPFKFLTSIKIRLNFTLKSNKYGCKYGI